MIILLMGVSLSSCDNESQAQNSQQPPTESNTKEADSSKDSSKEVTDSTTLDAADHKIQSKESKNTGSSIEGLKNQVSKIEGKEIWLWGVVILVCVISLILFVICFRLYSNLLGIVDRQRFDIEKLKKLKQEVAIAPKTFERTCVPSDYESLKQRIYNLELQIKQLASCQIRQAQTVSAFGSTGIEPALSKSGYFGNPTSGAEPYFKKLFVSRDSEARFSVEISGDKAIFKPIESSGYIGTLISNDAMRAAIEFQGFASIERPSMRVIMPGEAEHRDNRWFITKKAQVYLS